MANFVEMLAKLNAVDTCTMVEKIMVSDFLDEEWNILDKNEIEITMNVRLNFLEYMSFNKE